MLVVVLNFAVVREKE